jgi:hypothetical protein
LPPWFDLHQAIIGKLQVFQMLESQKISSAKASRGTLRSGVPWVVKLGIGIP